MSPELISALAVALVGLSGWLKALRDKTKAAAEADAKASAAELVAAEKLAELNRKVVAAEIRESQVRTELIISETRRAVAVAKVYEKTGEAIDSGRYQAIVSLPDQLDRLGDNNRELATKLRSLPPPKCS